MSSHPLFYGTLSNRQAAVWVGVVVALTLGAGVIATAASPVGLALAAAFYPPLAINAWIDAREHVLLKNWTHLAGVVWLTGLMVGTYRLESLVSAVMAAALFVGTSKLSRGALLGMGDARLLVVLAGWNVLWTPWGGLTMIVLAFAGHAIYVLGKAAFRRVRWTSRHPLGPWLVAGSWLAWLVTG